MNQRKIIFYSLAVTIIIFVLISVFVSCAMQDMQPALREDNTKPLDTPVNATANVKQDVACGWDAEEITAQQLDRMITFQQRATLPQEIKNLEDNIQYNRNKVAVMFYLAYAYEQTDNPDKAVELYKEIRNTYNNQHINLYIFDAPRVAANMRTYSVSIYEETLLRQFKLTNKSDLLQPLSVSSAIYGVEGKEGFLYADLAAQKPLRMSYDQFIRLSEAKQTINNFISACLKFTTENFTANDSLKPYITAQLADNIPSLIGVFQNLKNTEKLELEYLSLRKSGILYYYVFKITDTNISLEIMDNGVTLLVSRIK